MATDVALAVTTSVINAADDRMQTRSLIHWPIWNSMRFLRDGGSEPKTE